MSRADLDRLLPGVRPDPDAPPEGKVPSAVLVALIDMADGGVGVILTERSAGLRYHAGQISFPGGRIEDGESPVEAALREAEEEIALDRSRVTVLGHLPGVVTSAGFHIAPVLGRAASDFTPAPSPAEVERVLIEPVAPLLDRKNHVMVTREHGGLSYRSWDIACGRENIWGATARILVQWGELLAADEAGKEAGI